jgi:hypothetical protein
MMPDKSSVHSEVVWQTSKRSMCQCGDEPPLKYISHEILVLEKKLQDQIDARPTSK